MGKSFRAIPHGPINARRLDTTLVERLKSYSMKLTQVRYFSHASIILICHCISIAFAASAAAALFGFPDWLSFRQTILRQRVRTLQ